MEQEIEPRQVSYEDDRRRNDLHGAQQPREEPENQPEVPFEIPRD